MLDDDIDPSDLNQLIWAVATRHHPDRRITMQNQYMFPLVAYLSQEEKAASVSTRVIYNCLTPFGRWSEALRPVEASFRGYPEELKKHVIDNWKAYGF